MKGIRLFMSVALIALCATPAMSQFVRLEVFEIDNKGTVPGKTFRVYAVLESIGDRVYLVYGAEKKDSLKRVTDVLSLEVNTTTTFFQHPMGGALAVNTQKGQVDYYPELAYDSWFTIGAEDNYGGEVLTFPPGFSLSLDAFESDGKSMSTLDGAWFVRPDQRNCMAGSSKTVLLMQLTTTGEISGTLNLQGRLKNVSENTMGEIFHVDGVTFSAK
jgi:hypothetical protein